MTKDKNILKEFTFYLLAGIAFFCWENLCNSIAAEFNFELRRVVWGTLYYAGLFLIIGLIAHIYAILLSRIFRIKGGINSKIFSFTIITAVILEGFGIKYLPFGSAILGVFIWLGSAFLLSLILYSLLKGKDLSSVAIIFILYLILSHKVTAFIFSGNRPDILNLLLQPVIAGVAISIVVIIGKFFSTRRYFYFSFIWIPLLLTAAVAIFNNVFILPPDKSNLSSISFARNNSPNIAILLFDSLREDIVCQDSAGCTATPTIDSLATNDAKFYDCYATASYTFPSIVSLLTSVNQNELGLTEPAPLPENLPLMGSILRDYGYRTCAVSANDFFSRDYNFDRYFDEFYSLTRGFKRYLMLPFDSFFPNPALLLEFAYQSGFVSTDYITGDWRQINRKAFEIIARNTDQPLLLYLHYMDTHLPYWSLTPPGISLDWGLLCAAAAFSSPPISKMLGYETESLNRYLARKGFERCKANAASADEALSDFIRNLKMTGLDKNTFIIISSDHGDEFYEHNQFGHGLDLYNETVKVPLIFYPPAGSTVKFKESPGEVSTLDILPTVMDIAEIDCSNFSFQGISLINGETSSSRPHYMSIINRKDGNLWWSVVYESCKMITVSDVEGNIIDRLLFNLKEDPKEQYNIFGYDRQLCDSLENLLKTQIDKTVELYEPKPLNQRPDEKERLRALGYVK